MSPNSQDSSSKSKDDTSQRLRKLRRLGVRRGRAGLVHGKPSPGPFPPISQKESEGPAGSSPPTDITQRAWLQRIGAQEVFTPMGPCLVAEKRYPIAERRGRWPLGAVLAIAGDSVAACARDRMLDRFDFAQAAFLDTETSGLAGGAGTFAFMVGIGSFEAADESTNLDRGQDSQQSNPEHDYVVRQVFMRHPGEEPALLYVVERLLARCRGLVSFNGRAFDVPLLNNRYVLHHQPSPLLDLPHLDLLPAARQRWRLRLASCALGALESEVLHLERSQEDVPGWLIPSIYQAYARSASSSPEANEDMARVFYHNHQDIVNMVPLAAELCGPFVGRGTMFTQHQLNPIDLASLARCYEDLGWQEAGELAYRRALDETLPDSVRSLVLGRLGWLLKRQERREEAALVWQDWITSVPGPDPTPYEELAKHHEWHDVDLPAAHKWTLWGYHTAQQMPHGQRREQFLAALQHRLERLERKLSAAPDTPSTPMRQQTEQR